MVCDFCKDNIGTDETGIFCLEHEIGGHIICGKRHFDAHNDEEE